MSEGNYKFAEPGKYTVGGEGTGTLNVSQQRLFIAPPVYVGGYRLGLFSFNLTEKPSAWHRFWTRIVLGWTWEDAA